jgi:hypothetical protein
MKRLKLFQCSYGIEKAIALGGWINTLHKKYMIAFYLRQWSITMKTLIEAVQKFNELHAEENIFASFEYSGHVNQIAVHVERSNSRYSDLKDVEHLYSEYCYLDRTYGKQEDLKALTQHFINWIRYFEKDQAA